MILIDVLFPFLSFLIRGRIFAAIFALIFQITGILWIVAIIWAIVARFNAKSEKNFKKLEERIIESQQ